MNNPFDNLTPASIIGTPATSAQAFSAKQLANIAAGQFSSGLRTRSFESLSVNLQETQDPIKALKLCGADFSLGQTDLFAFASTPAGAVPLPAFANGKPQAFVTKIQSHKAVWRLNEDGKPVLPLGVVGTGYTFKQPIDSAEDLALWAGEGAVFTHGRLASDSTRLQLRARVVEDKILGDDVIGFSHLIDSYDGSSCFMVFDEIVRSVCRNGLVALISGNRNFRRRHRSSIAMSRQDIRAMMQGIRESLQALKDLAGATVSIHLTESRWQGIVNDLLPFPEAGTERQNRVVEEQRSVLHRAYTADDLGNFARSGWAALQAVADFSGHLGTAQRLGSEDSQIKKLTEVAQHNPMLERARELVLALN